MAGTQAYTGCLFESNGIWQMRAFHYEGGKRKSQSKSTKLPVKGNKKKAQAMLDAWLEELNSQDASFTEIGFFDYLQHHLCRLQGHHHPLCPRPTGGSNSAEGTNPYAYTGDVQSSD